MGCGSEERMAAIKLAPAFPGKRWLACGHFVDHPTQREICLCVRLPLSLPMLGRHVLERPDDRASTVNFN